MNIQYLQEELIKQSKTENIHVNDVIYVLNNQINLKPHIILLSGKFGSGKSYYAQKLKQAIINNNDVAMILSFANEVKKIAETTFGWDGVKDEKGRKLLQRIGTDVGRFYNEDIWVDKLNEQMEQNYSTLLNIKQYSKFKNCVFIVDDYRFTNEYDKIKLSFHFSYLNLSKINLFETYDSKYAFRIENKKNKLNYKDTNLESHPSETQIDNLKVDQILINDETNESLLETNLQTILNKIYNQ